MTFNARVLQMLAYQPDLPVGVGSPGSEALELAHPCDRCSGDWLPSSMGRSSRDWRTCNADFTSHATKRTRVLYCSTMHDRDAFFSPGIL